MKIGIMILSFGAQRVRTGNQFGVISVHKPCLEKLVIADTFETSKETTNVVSCTFVIAKARSKKAFISVESDWLCLIY